MEFPGGKLENGETPEQCLVREIEEELGIQIEVGQIYQAVHAHYDHGDFLIIAYLARQVEGEISLSVHSAYAWVDVDKLISTTWRCQRAHCPQPKRRWPVRLGRHGCQRWDRLGPP